MVVPESVTVHPLVLLSVVDHYNRVAKDTKKRVVGVLLGEKSKGVVDVTNSFAVPFEEDDKDPSIWFLDHSYLENMLRMFKKVNAREKVVGWYSTGPRLRPGDLEINSLIARFCECPLLVICEVQLSDIGLPIHAYCARDEVREDGTRKAQQVFLNLPTKVGQSEAEEIGVEHLLRNVKDASVGTLGTDIAGTLRAVSGLSDRLGMVVDYLDAVVAGKLPVNHDIMAGLQDVFNLLPNATGSGLRKALAVASNDMMMTVYVASIIRAVRALHNLVDNKEARIWKDKAHHEELEAEAEKEKKRKAEKEKEEEEKKEKEKASK